MLVRKQATPIGDGVAISFMRPSETIDPHRLAIRAAAARFRVANPCVFGSAAHGIDHEGSDLDVLVDALPDTTLFDLGGLQEELEALLGIRVDLRTPGDLPLPLRMRVLAGARPI